MKARLATPLFSLTLFGLLTAGCFGIRSGIDYPSYDRGKVQKSLETAENKKDPWLSLGSFKVRQSACEGVDTGTATDVLGEDDFGRFLQSQGAQIEATKARGNLYWYDFPGDNKKSLRLRIAVLDDAKQAADELHRSLLEHGPGWWGLRRSNLSILAPRASTGEAIAFALKYKLICWGMFEMAGADDVYVVAGPYMEL
jgi:hypothetical protein